MHLTSEATLGFWEDCTLWEILTKHVEFQNVLEEWHAMLRDHKKEVGKEESTACEKPDEGNNNSLLAKTCYYIRPDHKADTLIHNLHVKNSL